MLNKSKIKSWFPNKTFFSVLVPFLANIIPSASFQLLVKNFRNHYWFLSLISSNQSVIKCILVVPSAQTVKRLPTMQETWVQSLGQEDPLEKEMASHSSINAWKIPWTKEPGGLQSMGSQRVGHDWVTSFHFTSKISRNCPLSGTSPLPPGISKHLRVFSGLLQYSLNGFPSALVLLKSVFTGEIFENVRQCHFSIQYGLCFLNLFRIKVQVFCTIRPHLI